MKNESFNSGFFCPGGLKFDEAVPPYSTERFLTFLMEAEESQMRMRERIQLWLDGRWDEAVANLDMDMFCD